MRTLLLGFMLVLASCEDNCPKFQYRNYVYGDRVEVVGGFYKGQWGYIKDRNGYYLDGCYTPYFEVNLDYHEEFGHLDVEIDQYKLFVHRVEE